MIERLLARASGLDEDRKLAADFFLADVLIQLFRSQRPLKRLFLQALTRRRNDAINGRRSTPGRKQRIIMNGHTGIVLGD